MPRNRTRTVALSAISALLVVMASGSVPAAASGTASHQTVQRSAPAPTGSRSFIVQISSLAPTYSPATLAAWIRQACAATAAAGAPSRDLILQDITNPDGTLATAYIDAVLPFLPRGAQACFGRVFVGTVDLSWTGQGSKYVEGIQDPSFQAANLTQTKALASAFVARYPTVPINWYLTYEADLNDFYYPAVEGAFRSLLTAEMQALSALRPAAKFAWSPAFWYPYSQYSSNVAGMTGLETRLRAFFSALAQRTAGIQMLDLQDFVAGSRCQPPSNQSTAGDAVSWANFLVRLGLIREVTINVEQYAVDCATGALGPGDPAEVRARESFYASHAVTMGPAFELRYWIRTH